MNNESIHITILGSGTCVPSLKRSACSVLLKINNSKILIDSGPGTTRRLLEAGHNINQLSHIFYSHFHPDHISELISIIFSSKYSGLQRSFPLIITAGHGFLSFYKKLKTVFNNWIEMENMILDEISISGSGKRIFKDFELATSPTNHNPESIAFRFTNKSGKTVVYSGDTDESDQLEKIAHNADVFICESAMPDHLKVNGHLTPSLAGKIAQKASVKKLVLTHLYPECDETDLIKECQKTYSGHLLIAEDLMQLSV